MFSSEATGKCSKIRFLGSGRQGGIFELYNKKKLVRAVTPRTEFQNMKYTSRHIFLQKKLGITAGYSTFAFEALKTNVMVWRMFMSSSMQAAIHLGPNYLTNLEVNKNTNFDETHSLFNITQKLISKHSEEILNVRAVESTPPSWTRSTLSHDQMIRWTKAKVRIYAYSVLCLGKMCDNRHAIFRW